MAISKNHSKIGIVGGAGPYAGLDCAQKILQETIAEKDAVLLVTSAVHVYANFYRVTSQWI